MSGPRNIEGVGCVWCISNKNKNKAFWYHAIGNLTVLHQQQIKWKGDGMMGEAVRGVIF